MAKTRRVMKRKNMLMDQLVASGGLATIEPIRRAG